MLSDWEEMLPYQVKPLTVEDRRMITEAMESLEGLHPLTYGEVHWPIPRAALEGPHEEPRWISRWLTRRAARRS